MFGASSELASVMEFGFNGPSHRADLQRVVFAPGAGEDLIVYRIDVNSVTADVRTGNASIHGTRSTTVQ